MPSFLHLLFFIGAIATAAAIPKPLPLASSASLTRIRAINKTLQVVLTPGTTCTRKNENTGNYEGFCVDLLNELSQSLGFKYNLKPSVDGKYGSKDSVGQWDGAIGDVVKGTSDLALGDLTITAAREEVVDFTAPFLHTSVVAIYKKIEFNLEGFCAVFNPFSGMVWLTIILAFIASLASLRLVTYLSPHEGQVQEETGSSDAPLGQDLSLLNGLWLLASNFVLRPTDVKLQSSSSRLLAFAWSLFALLTVIIYASSVAQSFSDRTSSPTENTISGLLRQNFDFGNVASGSTSQLLKSNSLLQPIWNKIQSSGAGNITKIADGLSKVAESDGNYAFIGEEMALQAAADEDCSLVLTKGFHLRSFAIAVNKDDENNLREYLSQEILTLHETGKLYQLEQKWWPETICRQGTEEQRQRQINFSNFTGPLTLLGIGLVLAVIAAAAEKVWCNKGTK